VSNHAQQPKKHMSNKAKTSDTSVAHYEADIVAVGPQSADKDYPYTIRTKDGEYFKVWHDQAIRRGTAVTVDVVTWANGWQDTFLVTC
jgi:hypothetical protein|tara:strand:- start:294 stop:557 length:264 start_codon:yes stop_codon:yes gene_type:complete